MTISNYREPMGVFVTQTNQSQDPRLQTSPFQKKVQRWCPTSPGLEKRSPFPKNEGEILGG